ncbi:MAG: adenine nucleotide alpha hydrolase [Alphaproteobacteria bacterium]|nr:adenine nucleotide alpha hydrolase [Alphaproteobacteria bacterium]
MSAATQPALAAVVAQFGGLAVAVSGGVDSLTLAAFTHRERRGAVRMYHAVSPAVPPEATARTRALAAAEDWRLEVIDAGEFADPEYRRNPSNRCFFCKTNLYGAIAAHTRDQIVSGTNLDDLGEFRPGLDAARAHRVRHPYVEAGIDKRAVRRLAAALGLGAIADLPAAPCLASRVETGIRIEAPVLALVREAERLVTEALGTGGPDSAVRCRVRAGGIAIELDEASLRRLDAALELRLRELLGDLLQRSGLARPVRFGPYRAGSAFLRPTEAAGA